MIAISSWTPRFAEFNDLLMRARSNACLATSASQLRHLPLLLMEDCTCHKIKVT